MLQELLKGLSLLELSYSRPDSGVVLTLPNASASIGLDGETFMVTVQKDFGESIAMAEEGLTTSQVLDLCKNLKIESDNYVQTQTSVS